MTVTYVGDLSTDLDKARFYLNDTVEGSGPKPSDGNFSDAELNGLIAAEGSWQKAVAAGFETLAAAWRPLTDIRVGSRAESLSKIADGFAKDAEKWRAQYGGTASSVTSSAWTRVDGYSDDVAADEV